MNKKTIEWIASFLVFIACVILLSFGDLGISGIWFIASIFTVGSLFVPNRDAKGNIREDFSSFKKSKVFLISIAFLFTGIIQASSGIDSYELFSLLESPTLYSYFNCIFWCLIFISFVLFDAISSKEKISVFIILKMICKNFFMILFTIGIPILIQVQHR